MAAYVHLMVDAYPPFSLSDDPDYPVRLNVDYPERIDNWRPLVQWLLAIPYLFIAAVLLFTKKVPREMFDVMMPGLRWSLGGNSYAYFMTDRYRVWG